MRPLSLSAVWFRAMSSTIISCFKTLGCLGAKCLFIPEIDEDEDDDDENWYLAL